MSILDERFRKCVCLDIYDRIDSMQMLGVLIMTKMAKGLERRIS
jgi:hypothetical protein